MMKNSSTSNIADSRVLKDKNNNSNDEGITKILLKKYNVKRKLIAFETKYSKYSQNEVN